MSEQDELNITEVNKWSLDFVGDHKKLELMKFADGTFEIEIESGSYGENMTFNLSKDQKEYLIKWLQSDE
ncbi:unnamed protein product [marine sediment metagenome]|uniref:Uncharacterized protein n=1 Tax=marine sediment metagenome TaxID=412755 RepID=X0SCP5_9ZZZZ